MDIIRTPQGAYFVNTEEGVKAISDPALIQSLQSGATPYTSVQGLNNYKVANTVYSPQTANTQIKTPVIPQTTESQTNQDPLTKFNLSILDMLKKAQGGAGNEDLYKQQTALRRAAIGRQAAVTPEDLRMLSPNQQSAIRSGNISALEPEIDAIGAKIKANDSRLANFESILGQMKSIGEDIAKITPSASVISGYVNMLKAGGSPTSIPDEVRNTVMEKMTTADWAAWSKMTNKASTDQLTLYQQTQLDQNKQSKAMQIAAQFDTNPIVKQYNTIAEAVNFNSTAGTTPTDDISRIYNFAKVMDPNSVVREGEYKTVQDYATTLLQRTGLKAQRVFANTGFFTAEARKFMQDTLNRRLTSSETNYKNTYDEYARRIDNITGIKGEGSNFLTNYAAAYGGFGNNNVQDTTEPETKTVTINKVDYIYIKDPQTGLWKKQ